MRPILLYIVLFVSSFKLFGQEYSISGQVTDVHGDAIPFVSVYIKNTIFSTIANERGNYNFNLAKGTYTLTFRYVGYKQQERDIMLNESKVLNIALEYDVYSLEEVKIASTRKDPARGIVQKVIDNRKNLLKESSFFTCDAYTKQVQKLIKAPKKFLGQDVVKTMKLDSNRQTILYQSETYSKFYSKGDKQKEVMKASKIAGDNQGFSFNRALDARVNFYNNYLHWEALGKQNFVSPVARNAFSFYSYKLAGTTKINKKTIYKIRVTPRYRYSASFRGDIYIVKDEWRLYSVDLYLTGETRIEFVDTMKISQQFVELRPSTWQPSDITFRFSGKVLGFQFAGYFVAVYNNYVLNPRLRWNFFNNEILKIESTANKKTKAYWDTTRPVPLTFQEEINYFTKDSLEAKKKSKRFLDSLQRKQNRFKPVKALIAGYQLNNLSNNSYWYFYPLQRIAFYNPTEGLGINLRARYNKKYSYRRYLEFEPSVRYGFQNKVLNANAEITYQYDTLNHAAVSFKGGSDFLDLNNKGTINLFYNTLTNLFRGRNYLKLYRANFASVRTQRELIDGLQVTAGVEMSRRMPVRNSRYATIYENAAKLFEPDKPFNPESFNDTELFPINNAFAVEMKGSYTYGQKYTTRPDGKIYEPAKYPTVQVDYRKGFKTIFNSAVDYDFVALDVFQDKIKVGLTGYSSFYLSAGRFVNAKSVFFPDLKHFTGNQTAIYNPIFPNYHFLDYYAFSTNNKYFEAHYEHNFSGLLINKLPLLRKLKLEEIVGGAYLGQPLHNYSEVYLGIQRLIFRIDYGMSWVDSRRVSHAVRIFYGF